MWRFFTSGGAEKHTAATVTNPAAYSQAVSTVIANNTTTRIAVPTLNWQTVAGMVDTTNGRIIIPSAGKYAVTLYGLWATNATGERVMTMIQRDSTLVTIKQSPSINANAVTGDTTGMSETFIIDALAGDQIEFVAVQNSGGNLTLNFAGLQVVKCDGAVVSYVGVPGSLVGQELGYAEFTGTVSSTTATEAAPLDVVAAPSITFDGSTPVLVEFFCPTMVTGGTASCGISLWEDSTDKGRLYDDSGQSITAGYARFTRRYTPSAGAHVLKVRLWTTASNNLQLQAGAGGVATRLPGFIRVTRAA